MPTSQPLGTLTATHEPTARLVAHSHRPGRTLLYHWRDYRARRPPPRPAGPVVVELPKHLLN
jgi:hypothetical protein